MITVKISVYTPTTGIHSDLIHFEISGKDTNEISAQIHELMKGFPKKTWQQN